MTVQLTLHRIPFGVETQIRINLRQLASVRTRHGDSNVESWPHKCQAATSDSHDKSQGLAGAISETPLCVARVTCRTDTRG